MLLSDEGVVYISDEISRQCTDAVIQEYSERLRQHIRYVREAGARVGVNPHLLEIHDKSKWTPEEFPAYAHYFCSGVDVSSVDAVTVSSDFARAWLHHIHANPHHWQHWMFPDGYSPKNSGVERGVVEMPTCYALEMIADWMGASRVYTGSWDITDWLHKNMERIHVHSCTAKFLRDAFVSLTDIAHPDIVNGCRFASELED